MAQPKKAARGKGRSRRRVKKNIAYGIAHIKTSFNNTIVTITDTDGSVVCWESAGSGRDTAFRSLQAAGLQVMTVKDVTPQAHNGCRPRKRRRV